MTSIFHLVHEWWRSMDSQSDVDWCLDVLIHGLTDPSLVPDTIMVFSDWLSVLLPYPSSNIPKYILTECNFMSRKMFRILYRLFATVNGIFKKYTFKGRYTYTYTDLAKPCELRGYIKGFLALLWFCFFLGWHHEQQFWDGFLFGEGSSVIGKYWSTIFNLGSWNLGESFNPLAWSSRPCSFTTWARRTRVPRGSFSSLSHVACCMSK